MKKIYQLTTLGMIAGCLTSHAQTPKNFLQEETPDLRSQLVTTLHSKSKATGPTYSLSGYYSFWKSDG